MIPKAIAFDDPPVAYAAPVQVADSEVMGLIAAKDTTQTPPYEKLEQAVTDIWDEIVRLRDEWGEYGFIHWGLFARNLYRDGTSQPGVVWSDGEPYAGDLISSSWRYTLDGSVTQMAWTQFLRSGERRYWKLARDSTRFFGDLRVAHLDGARRNKGMFWDHSSSPTHIPWASNSLGGAKELGSFESHVEDLLLDYYVTGDLRSLEIFHEMEAPFLSRIDEFDGVTIPVAKEIEQSIRKAYDDVHKAGAYHNHTGNQAYADFASGVLDLLEDTDPANPYKVKLFPDHKLIEYGWPLFPFYKQPMLAHYARHLTSTEKIRTDGIQQAFADWIYFTHQQQEPQGHPYDTDARAIGRILAEGYRQSDQVIVSNGRQAGYLALALDRLRWRHDDVFYDPIAQAGSDPWPVRGGLLPLSANVVMSVAYLTRQLPEQPELYPIYDTTLSQANVPQLFQYKNYGQAGGLTLDHPSGQNTFAWLVVSDLDEEDPDVLDFTVVGPGGGTPGPFDAFVLEQLPLLNVTGAGADAKPQRLYLLWLTLGAPTGEYTIEADLQEKATLLLMD